MCLLFNDLRAGNPSQVAESEQRKDKGILVNHLSFIKEENICGSGIRISW